MAHLYADVDEISPYIKARKKFYQPKDWDNMVSALKTSTTLYVGNLSFYTEEEQIYALFSMCGPVRRIIMGIHKFNKTPCGFCFVEYYFHKDAMAARDYINGTKLDERLIRVDIDPGFEQGRQYGRGQSGGQVRDDRRSEYDEGRGGLPPKQRRRIEEQAYESGVSAVPPNMQSQLQTHNNGHSGGHNHGGHGSYGSHGGYGGHGGHGGHGHHGGHSSYHNRSNRYDNRGYGGGRSSRRYDRYDNRYDRDGGSGYGGRSNYRSGGGNYNRSRSRGGYDDNRGYGNNRNYNQSHRGYNDGNSHNNHNNNNNGPGVPPGGFSTPNMNTSNTNTGSIGGLPPPPTTQSTNTNNGPGTNDATTLNDVGNSNDGFMNPPPEKRPRLN